MLLSDVCGQTWLGIFCVRRATCTGLPKDIKQGSPGAQGIIDGCRMFDEYRARIIESLPKDLSEEEFKRELFERIYGAPMEDFLTGKVTDAGVIHEDCS